MRALLVLIGSLGAVRTIQANSVTDAACHLQVAALPALGTGTDCPLPSGTKWVEVSKGPTHEPFQMAVYDSSDIVSQSISSTGTWEAEANSIAELGAPGHALDIGANVGYYSLILAASGWNVTAFEPMVKNNELIKASLCKNPALKSKIKLNEFGLGAENDHCKLISGVTNVGDGVFVCGEAAKQPIQTDYVERASMDIRRLDDVLLEQNVDHIDFVKMDVEGFECKVMLGGQSLLTKFRPKLIQSEVWHSMQGCRPQDYLSSFAAASYTVSKESTCKIPDLSRPGNIENRYMCRKPEVTLLETGSIPKENERSIVWLQAA